MTLHYFDQTCRETEMNNGQITIGGPLDVTYLFRVFLKKKKAPRKASLYFFHIFFFRVLFVEVG